MRILILILVVFFQAEDGIRVAHWGLEFRRVLFRSWWNSREDFERSQKIIAAPDRLDAVKEDEDRLFASHANPVCSVIEYDSPMGPAGEATRIELKYGN